jgi:hypothetical protein
MSLLFVLRCFVSFSQSTTMENYRIVNIGTISIPTIMEVQSGNYKKLSDAYQNEFGKQFGYEVSDNKVVFQQKGLNNLEKSSFASYARVILETSIGSYGDFEKLNVKITAKEAELGQLNDEFKNQVQLSFADSGLKLIRWLGVSVVTINGQSCIKISYVRQLENRPYVLVNIYRFQNNDRMHTLTLSYSQDDEFAWKPLFTRVLNSFIITNIR